MYNSFIKYALLALLAGLCFCVVAEPSNVRFTAVRADTVSAEVTVAGLQSAVSNGCPWLSLAFSDSLGNTSIWPGGYQWHTDYAPVALHRFDASKSYQRFSGAHFWKAVCSSNNFELAYSQMSGPSFAPGDASGYVIVSNVPAAASYRVYGPCPRDGVFIYYGNAPHWMVWTTNSGAAYESGWPFVNVPIGTNETYTFRNIPVRWGIATKAVPARSEDDFALVPGVRGVCADFYIALTEATEATVSAVVSNGVALGLCRAGDYAGSAGRGGDYPDTGRTLAEALALCNLATRLHNAVTGDALAYVYTFTNAPFFSPVSNVLDVAAVVGANGYRLPSRSEYATAAAGDARTAFPWGGPAAHEWFTATNGLPVTESIFYTSKELRDFYLKYQYVTTNSTANFMSRNGHRHLSPGRVDKVRSQFKGWSVPVVNAETGLPVMISIGGLSFQVYFGDSTTDGAWGIGTRQVHDLAGNVSEMTWPPVGRPWGGVRVCLMGGAPALDSGFARAGVPSWCSADVRRETVGFRFARNKLEVQP